MARVCVLLADGCEEIEAVTVIDVLRRAQIEVTALGVEGEEARGSHGICLRADRRLDQATADNWDLVVLPGGLPGATTLRDSAAVQALLRAQQGRGGKLAAICAGPIALARAGVLEGRKATSYPGCEDQLAGATRAADAVVQDGNVTTSRGPGTAMQFALTLVADLRGADVARGVAEKMLVAL